MSVLGLAKHLIMATAAQWGYRIERRYEIGAAELDLLQILVERLGPERDDFFVIQVGANDGEAHDPINAMIHRHRWRGVLLEPQPNAFRRLVEHYRGFEGLQFENAALARIDGTMPFWTVPEHSGLGSLNKTILRRSGDIGAAAIREITVATISAATLVRKYDISRVDLLQVDTEGYDFEVIKAILGADLRPALINYEHLHLSTSDRIACVRFLGEHGYRLIQAGANRIDTVALYGGPAVLS